MKKAKLSGEQMLTIKQRASNGNYTLEFSALLLVRETSDGNNILGHSCWLERWDVTACQLCVSDLAHCRETTEAELIRP